MVKQKEKDRVLHEIQLATRMDGEIFVEMKSEVAYNSYWITAGFKPYGKESLTTHFFTRQYQNLNDANTAYELITETFRNFTLAKIGVYI
jgi:hypothetical protein